MAEQLMVRLDEGRIATRVWVPKGMRCVAHEDGPVRELYCTDCWKLMGQLELKRIAQERGGFHEDRTATDISQLMNSDPYDLAALTGGLMLRDPEPVRGRRADDEASAHWLGAQGPWQAAKREQMGLAEMPRMSEARFDGVRQWPWNLAGAFFDWYYRLSDAEIIASLILGGMVTCAVVSAAAYGLVQVIVRVGLELSK